jgi:hypothetical protein
MKKFTFPNRQAFNALLLDNADGSNYGIELDNATDAQKIAFLVDTIKSELGFMLERQSVFTMAKYWLQGLASACTIPFYNGHIIDWLESQGYVITPHNEYTAIDQYWNDAALALAAMINKTIKG